MSSIWEWRHLHVFDMFFWPNSLLKELPIFTKICQLYLINHLLNPLTSNIYVYKIIGEIIGY